MAAFSSCILRDGSSSARYWGAVRVSREAPAGGIGFSAASGIRLQTPKVKFPTLSRGNAGQGWGTPFDLKGGFLRMFIQVLLDSFWQARGVEDVSELGWWDPAREFDCTREGSVCICAAAPRGSQGGRTISRDGSPIPQRLALQWNAAMRSQLRFP